jgi:Icc-related predicted phosphoesterase
MAEIIYLVFGDLHGRILPAFRLAAAWSRDHGFRIDGLLQVGDLGYFPDVSRLDKATRRHAADDPLELGALDVTEPSQEADRVFAEEFVPETLWFTAGNHEDHEFLYSLAHGDVFAVDAYQRIRCIRDGHVAFLSGGLRVGALWGIDGQAPVRRRHAPSRCLIQADSAVRLACSSFDVLLTHDSPLDAIIPNAGSQEILDIIQSAQPTFAFFGHHKGRGHQIEGDFGATRVYHLAGMELRQSGHHAEEGSVGVLRWDGTTGSFAYMEPAWLRSFTRSNWRYR